MKLDKNVPMPSSATGGSAREGGSNHVAVVKAMEIGDSFLIPAQNSFLANTSAARSYAMYHAKTSGKKMVSKGQKDSDGNYIGLRIWRVE